MFLLAGSISADAVAILTTKITGRRRREIGDEVEGKIEVKSLSVESCCSQGVVVARYLLVEILFRNGWWGSRKTCFAGRGRSSGVVSIIEGRCVQALVTT